jgi:2-hydroxychromene-2-carboxylate isomerase
LNTLVPQRVLCAWPDDVTLSEAARALFRAYWADDKDVSSHDVVCEVLAPLRSDAEAIVEAAGSPEVKARLRENTEAAIAAGVFGLPAFHVGDRFWWGHDRIDLAIRAAQQAKRVP